jgi:hypothetical protein
MILLLVAALLAGDDPTQAAATTAAAAAVTPAAAVASAGAVSAAPAAKPKAKRSDKICREETPTGSHFSKMVCVDRDAAEARTWRDEQFMRDIRVSGPGPTAAQALGH